MSVKTVYRQGRTEVDGRAFLDYVVRTVIDHANLDASYQYRIPIDIGRQVLSMRLRVAEAFAGGTPTIKVGDLQDDDGYIKTTDLDVTSLNAVIDSQKLGTEEGTSGVTTFNACAKGGRFYAASNQIVVTGTASLTAGKLVLEVVYSGYQDPTVDMIANQ